MSNITAGIQKHKCLNRRSLICSDAREETLLVLYSCTLAKKDPPQKVKVLCKLKVPCRAIHPSQKALMSCDQRRCVILACQPHYVWIEGDVSLYQTALALMFLGWKSSGSCSVWQRVGGCFFLGMLFIPYTWDKRPIISVLCSEPCIQRCSTVITTTHRALSHTCRRADETPLNDSALQGSGVKRQRTGNKNCVWK